MSTNTFANLVASSGAGAVPQLKIFILEDLSPHPTSLDIFRRCEAAALAGLEGLGRVAVAGGSGSGHRGVVLFVSIAKPKTANFL